MNDNDIKKLKKEWVPATTVDLSSHPVVKGYDFEGEFDFNKLLQSYSTTGFQATNLARAIDIIKEMREQKAKIFLGFTGNMISCGLRESIKYLVKNKLVDVLVTNAGGVEEDIIKCLGEFRLGDFRVPGKFLFEKGVNRIGNIFVANDNYAYFDKFMTPFFKRMYEKQKNGGIITSRKFIDELGKSVNDETSVLYWAHKNNIPVFCPAITDGSIGDLLFFFKHSNKDFILDVSQDTVDITKLTLDAEKSGVIIIGGGSVKHYLLNAHIFRDGADYTVLVNTSAEFDGSDSGGHPQEAITWGKIKVDSPCVKVHAEASIVFPLLVAGGFKC